MAHPFPCTTARDAIAKGIYLIPEDRKRSGLVLDLPIVENISLADLRTLHARDHASSGSREQKVAEEQRRSLDIKAPSVDTAAVTLSGGNQQKVVLGKWLSMRPKVIIFDEPTRGIDVGAKSEIYALMRGLADAGVAILMISSDMEEVIGVSDRIAVMHEGQISGFLEPQGFLRTQRPDACRRANEPRRTLPLMLKKELGLALLILVIGGVTAAINPQFISQVNLMNLANQIGLFGLFAIGVGLVIITGGIDLSIGSMLALAGRDLPRSAWSITSSAGRWRCS